MHSWPIGLGWWTGPVFLAPMKWVWPQQGTTFEDEESMRVRFICHQIIDLLPRGADEELLEVLVGMMKFYADLPESKAAPERQVGDVGRRPIKKITRSVRRDISLPDEG